MSTRALECGSCGMDHPSAKPCKTTKAPKTTKVSGYVILPPVQQLHPDSPKTGWTCTVLKQGKLVARFFGTTDGQVSVRAHLFASAMQRAFQ